VGIVPYVIFLPQPSDTASVYESAMQPYTARWCHTCLRPIDEDDRDLVYLFMRVGEMYRDVIVHGRCYAEDRTAATSPVMRPEAWDQLRNQGL